MKRIIVMDARITNGITDGMFVNINGATLKKNHGEHHLPPINNYGVIYYFQIPVLCHY